MKAVRNDTDTINDQIDGFNIDILPKSVGDTVQQAIEYRKQHVWGTNDGSIDVEDLPYKTKLSAIADDLHENKRKVAVLVDVDVDGFASSAIIYRALKAINSDLSIDALLPDAKLHGIKANVNLVTKDYDYLFLPDSSANDLHTIAELQNDGTQCVVIDHHVLEQEPYLLDNPGKFLICSNQYQDGRLNRNLTGAGMCLLVAKLWKQKYDIELDYDLAALGQIGDMSDLGDVGIYGIVKQGLSEMNSKMLTTFFANDPEVLSVKHLQFSLIPRINSVSRIGEHEDRKLIFDALIDQDELKPVNVRKKGSDGKFHTETVQMNVYERAKRTLTKVKGRQDRLVKNGLKDIEWLTDGGDGFNAVVLDKKFDRGIAGLVSNKLLGQTKKPTLTLKRNSNKFEGSARFPAGINGLKLLGSIDGVFTGGHKQAFGTDFPVDKFGEVSKAIRIASKQSPDYVFHVDSAYVNELPSVKEIRDIYQSSVKFRGAKDQPLIAVLGLKVAKKDIRLKNNWLQLKIGGITIDNFNTTSELKRYVKNGFGDKCFSFVCSASMNFWGKKATPQLIVDTMTISGKVFVPTTKDNFIF